MRAAGALAGDLDDQRALDKLRAAVDGAQSALTGTVDALAILARQKAEAESALATERTQAEQVAAANSLEKQIAAIETAAAPRLAQSRSFTDAALLGKRGPSFLRRAKSLGRKNAVQDDVRNIGESRPASVARRTHSPAIH